MLVERELLWLPIHNGPREAFESARDEDHERRRARLAGLWSMPYDSIPLDVRAGAEDQDHAGREALEESGDEGLDRAPDDMEVSGTVRPSLRPPTCRRRQARERSHAPGQRDVTAVGRQRRRSRSRPGRQATGRKPLTGCRGTRAPPPARSGRRASWPSSGPMPLAIARDTRQHPSQGQESVMSRYVQWSRTEHSESTRRRTERGRSSRAGGGAG